MPPDPFLAATMHLLHGVTTWDITDDDPDAPARLTEFLADSAEPGLPDVTIEARFVSGPLGDIEIRL